MCVSRLAGCWLLQISCVTATVDNSVSERDNVLGINKLADAAKACNSTGGTRSSPARRFSFGLVPVEITAAAKSVLVVVGPVLLVEMPWPHEQQRRQVKTRWFCRRRKRRCMRSMSFEPTRSAATLTASV